MACMTSQLVVHDKFLSSFTILLTCVTCRLSTIKSFNNWWLTTKTSNVSEALVHMSQCHISVIVSYTNNIPNVHLRVLSSSELSSPSSLCWLPLSIFSAACSVFEHLSSSASEEHNSVQTKSTFLQEQSLPLHFRRQQPHLANSITVFGAGCRSVMTVINISSFSLQPYSSGDGSCGFTEWSLHQTIAW